jgi:hypothetical protein
MGKERGCGANTHQSQASCSLTTMSSANSFAALATPAPATTPIPPFGAGSSILGSKCPCSPSSSPPKVPWAPPVPLPVDNVPDGSEYSVFDIQNIFYHRWFINRDHLIANVLSATKDNDSRFVWVDFLPQFHTSLIKRMVTLLPPGVAVSRRKKILFVFLLEILTGDEGIKPEVFWHTHKKHSRASQATHKAKVANEASNPLPLPSAPASVPTLPPATAPEPSALSTEEQMAMILDAINQANDTPMRAPTPSPPKQKVHNVQSLSNQELARSFPRNVNNTRLIQTWCIDARRRGFQWGNVCNSIRTAGHASLLQPGLFIDMVTRFFQTPPPLRPGGPVEAGPSTAKP